MLRNASLANTKSLWRRVTSSQAGTNCEDCSSRGNREAAVYLSYSKEALKEAGKRLHVKPRNERQEVFPRYPEVSPNSPIISLQEHRGCKKSSLSERRGVLGIEPEWQTKMWCYHNYFKSFEPKPAMGAMFLVPPLCWF